MSKRKQYLNLLNKYRQSWITRAELYTASSRLGVSEETVATDIAKTSNAKHGSSSEEPPAPAPTISREMPTRRP
jgi:hypothetical protein